MPPIFQLLKFELQGTQLARCGDETHAHANALRRTTSYSHNETTITGSVFLRPTIMPMIFKLTRKLTLPTGCKGKGQQLRRQSTD